jgi:hypothetical protein
MMTAKLTFRLLYRVYLIDDKDPKHPSLQLIQDFWKKNIHSFSIKHGTSSLYEKHFRKFGLSSVYPEPFQDIVKKVRQLWDRYEKEVFPKSDYFRWFEQRFDKAYEQKRIEFSFAANKFRTQEYTVGRRGHGGEWMREVRRFLSTAKEKNIPFSQDEQNIFDRIETLSDLLYATPPMTINIRGGSAAFVQIFPQTHLCSLQDLVSRIQKTFSRWQEPRQLRHYLSAQISPAIRSEIDRWQNSYEIMVNQPVPSDLLDFDISEKKKKR